MQVPVPRIYGKIRRGIMYVFLVRVRDDAPVLSDIELHIPITIFMVIRESYL